MPRHNPDFVGLTENEKKALGARNYRAKNREQNRAYMREYMRKYTHNPAKLLTQVERDIAVIEQRIKFKTEVYHKYVDPLATKLINLQYKKSQLVKAIEENAALPKGEQIRFLKDTPDVTQSDIAKG